MPELKRLEKAIIATSWGSRETGPDWAGCMIPGMSVRKRTPAMHYCKDLSQIGPDNSEMD